MKWTMCNKTDQRNGRESTAKPGTAVGVAMRLAAPHRRNRGTALILTVVSLMLMAVLGMAYIQSARASRQAKHNVATSGNLDMVVKATLTQIGNVLKEDLLDNDGDEDGSARFFNGNVPDLVDFDKPTDPDAGGGDEPYDYPWTNDQVGRTVVLYDGTVVPHDDAAAAKGGQQDDAWLAATAPVMSDATETNWTWPHITNLNGIFLTSVQDGSLTKPTEVVVNYQSADEKDSDVRFLTNGSNNTLLDNGDLVDADGDGIADSRWTWAPVRKVGGVVYVMAVRIIDNSSLINANVALSTLGDYSGTYKYDDSSSGADSPRWWSPAELDLGNFVYSHAGVSTTITNELKALLDERVGTDALPTPWGESSGQRHHFWRNGPAMYGNFDSTYKHLTIDDELELRYRNGLNDDGTVSGLESVMPDFLRGSATGEYRYSNVPGVPDASTATSDVDAYFEKNPRLWMTAVSGAAVYAPPFSENGDASLSRKTDLNQANLTTLSNAIRDVLDAGAAAYPIPVAYADTTEFADQFAVCIKDYADTDNKLTEHNGRYGMEALPAIAEVYAQGRYVATSASALASPPAAANSWDVDWDRVGIAGFAIEIRNPFPMPIKLTDVNLWVGGSDWGSLDTLAGQTELDVDEVLIFYRHSRDTNSGDDKVDSLWSSGNITPVVLTSQTWPDTDGAITVELRVKDDGDNAMVKPYAAAESEGLPIQKTLTEVSPVDPAGTVDYWQITAIGNGNGLNTLTIKPDEFVPGGKNPSPVPAPVRNASFVDLGEAIKSNGAVDKINLATNPSQILISDEGDINQVGELAHIAIIGPVPGSSKTVADVWDTASDVKAFMLDFGTNVLVDVGKDALAVPHAVLMLDRFTTMSPAVDGKDNDGDGVNDNQEEQLIPGTINLNTVPGIEAVDENNDTHLLQRVLPIQDRIVRRDVIKAILNYRDKAAPYHQTSTRDRNNPGIAYIGELMKCVAATSQSIDVLANGTLYPGDTSILSDGSDYVVDFLSPDNAADGIADDREEEAMIMRWLAQTCSTRSDIFTAYVVIQGFPADDFTKGAVESRRFYAVFDRSRITGKNDVVRVLGVRELH